MTVAVEISELEQVKKQLHKLVNVIKITEFKPETSVEKETIMVRVSVPAGKRGDVLELVGIFSATVIDVSPGSLMFSLTGSPRRVNDFLDLVRPFGIVDLVKSGRIALARESKTRKTKKH